MNPEQIIIGEHLALDIPILLKTRLLVQANSGGGKSWLLRRLAEQLFGKVPVIIVDPEGEFATLREKFGYVLVGKGGETPADPRSIKLVMHKLLELRASAVIDLYEMNPGDRHRCVRLLSEAAIDAPKTLWQPTVFIFDEAHTFCPEKGAGESEASDAVTAFPTRGRKRRFCAVFATQRLGKLRKDASAELLNRLVGPTFEDVDLKRAADLLSIPGDKKREFDQEMRLLEPGHFYALGRALCKERTRFKVGPVQTSHEIEDAKFGAEPPPSPHSIRALLPKLADLPKAAEEKARTEAELRTEIRSLKAQLAARPEAAPVVETKEVSVLTDDDRKKLQRVLDFVGAEVLDNFTGLFAKVNSNLDDMRRFLEPIRSKLSTVGVQAPLAAEGQHQAGSARKSLAPSRKHYARVAPPAGDTIGWSPGKCERALLSVLAQFPEGCNRKKLILLAGYHWSGSTQNALGRLRTEGCVTGANHEIMRITDAGLAHGPFSELPQGQALVDYWLNHPQFGRCERELLRHIAEHPKGLTRDQLLELSGYEWSGSTQNALGALRTAEVIVGRNNELMRLSPEITD